MPPEPEVPITVEFRDSLAGVVKQNQTLQEEICGQLHQEVARVLQSLGIPGKPAVSLSPKPKKPLLAHEIFCLNINGICCRYPHELLQRVYCYVQGVPLGPAHTLSDILTWLDQHAQASSLDNQARRDLVDFITRLCLEIVKNQPDCLLGPPQCEAYAESKGLADFNCLPRPDGLRSALSQVLKLRISIADPPTVNIPSLILSACKDSRIWEDAAENLIAALRPRFIEIQLPLPYLQAIAVDKESNRTIFPQLRDHIFSETGLRLPDFRFVPVDHLKPNTIAIQINHLPCAPWVGLPPGQLLVDAGLDASPASTENTLLALHPVSLTPCQISSSAANPAREPAAMSGSGPMAYLSLCLAADIKKNYAGLICQNLVQGYLNQLQEPFPDLVRAVNDVHPVWVITRVLRQMLSEGLSIRNLRAILEALLDVDYLVIGSEYNVFDCRLKLARQPEPNWRQNPQHLANYVRQCLGLGLPA